MPVEGFVPLHALGFARMIREDYSGAETFFREANEIAQKYLGPTSPYSTAMREGLAFAIGLEGRYSEAERELSDCLALRRKGKSAQTEYVASAARLKLAEVQMAEGNRAAEENLRAILALYRQVSPKGGRRVAYVAAKLGECLLAEGRREEAATLLKEGYEGLLASCGPQHPYTVRVRKLLAATGS
jgi:ATP/maltotriose-dependent transcriptional regulator MalT